jgi:hypothetical protein
MRGNAKWGVIMEWPQPFVPIDRPETKSAFEAELQRELKPGHPLFGIRVMAIGARYDQDDVVFELLDGSGRFADVHLTWAGEKETPPWPGVALFESFIEWAKSVNEELA